MKEIFSMWKNTKMIVLVALSAAIYAAVLIPFKAIPLIPGVTELRPASALPVIFGLLFGPAGAWGSAIGNLIGDFFGSLGPGSFFGFIGNFLFAYIPYKLWANMGLVEKNTDPKIDSTKKAVLYIICGIAGSLACALVIAWGLEILNLVPFSALSVIIALNNSIPSLILGLPLIVVLYPRVKKWDLLWTDTLAENLLPKSGVKARLGAIIMCLASIGGFFVSVLVSMGVGQELFSFASKTGSVPVMITAGISVLLIFISAFMQ